MSEQLFSDIAFSSTAKHGESARGDCFLSRRDGDGSTVVAVLSDGLGSGIKANVLATLTAKIALDMFSSGEDLLTAAGLIYTSLPTCSERRISYATFSVLRSHGNGDVTLIEFDNPPALVIRNNELLELETEVFTVPRPRAAPATITRRVLHSLPGDRVVFFSDGVSQAGMGSPAHPLGWQDVFPYIRGLLNHNPQLGSTDLSKAVLRRAEHLDGMKARDDISCGVLHVRHPRKTVLVSGPPFHPQGDEYLASLLKNFEGKKAVCGGTTAQIIAREWGEQLHMDLSLHKGSLPPMSRLKGVDLVSEGILTISALKDALEHSVERIESLDPPVEQLQNLLLNSDSIRIVGGTRINEAHQDPNMPMELEIRRNALRSLGEILKTRYLKEVELEFI